MRLNLLSASQLAASRGIKTGPTPHINRRITELAVRGINDMTSQTTEKSHETLTADERMELIRQNYVIERELSDKLRNSSAEERKLLYTSLYDEYHKRAPFHPSKARKDDTKPLRRRMRLLKNFLSAEDTFLEVGPGDGQVCLAVSEIVQQVVAVDVSREITKCIDPPENFRLVISDGSSINVDRESVDIAYSNQLMEHLHPDDAKLQLENICLALRLGGKYICITPNALSGPHDISKYFDDVAKGFHLKEYTIKELTALFKKAGFRKVFYLWAPKGFLLKINPGVLIALEEVLFLLPEKLRKKISQSRLMFSLLNIQLLGVK